MSDINALALYANKEREFSLEGAGNVRFQSDFLVAVNRAIRRINIDADLVTAVATISDTNPGTSIGLDDVYEGILSDIVTVELVKLGQRPKRKEFELTFKDLVQSIPGEIDMIRTRILQTAQDADTDEETSFIGMNRH